MKNSLLVTLLLMLSVTLFSSCEKDEESRMKVLKVYNWADYIGKDVITDFEAWYKKETGEDIRVIYQTFDINEIMLTKIERGHEDFDLICPSEYILERMLKQGLLLPLNKDFGKTQNYIQNQSPFIDNQLNKLSQPNRAAADYMVGYMWGTAGILYNTEFVDKKDVQSWECLWNPKFAQKLLMKDAYRDAYGTATIYANAKNLADGTVTVEQLMNTNTEASIQTAEAYLKRLKPNIVGWETDFGKEMMTQKKAWLNLTWSGDAVWAQEEAAAVGVKLDYLVPIEGSNIWYDGWAIPKYARNTKAASYFVNFMCRPDIALRNMKENGYVSAIASPEILAAYTDTTFTETVDLSYFFGADADSVHVNPIIYPGKKVVERCAMIRDFGPDTDRVLDMWSRVKGDSLGSGTLFLIIGVFALLLVTFIYRKMNKRKQANKSKKSRRKK